MSQICTVCSRTRSLAARLAALAGILGSLIAGIPTAFAQGGWRQTEFMIGTWEDPVTPPSVNDVLYFQQAKDAYFNLLTGSVYHGPTLAPGSPFGPAPIAKFDAASAVGLNVL